MRVLIFFQLAILLGCSSSNKNDNEIESFKRQAEQVTIIRDESLHQRLYVDNYLKNCQQNGSRMPPNICHE